MFILSQGERERERIDCSRQCKRTPSKTNLCLYDTLEFYQDEEWHEHMPPLTNILSILMLKELILCCIMSERQEFMAMINCFTV